MADYPVCLQRSCGNERLFPNRPGKLQRKHRIRHRHRDRRLYPDRNPYLLDAITDPMVAFLYDRINTRFGKLRIMLAGGFIIEAIALLAMFDFASSKGFGTIVFILLYCLYVIGYTITNMTAQTIPALLSNDPKQRPIIGVWATAFNYLVPITLTIVLNVVLLPMFGGNYNQAFLSTACRVCVLIGLLGIILVCIGVSEIDKPENFTGTAEKKSP